MKFQLNFKRIATVILYTIIFLVPAVFIQFFSDSELFHQIETYVHEYYYLYIFSILFVKAASIVYPPLPGVAATLSTIPFIGWQQAYMLDLVGSIIGVSISYHLGKKYGESILRRVLGDKLTDKMIAIKLKQTNQLEALLVLRIAAGGMLSDGLAWGASLIGFSFIIYLIGHVLVHVVTTIPVFYLLSISSYVHSVLGLGAAALLAWGLLIVFKGRYFE